MAGRPKHTKIPIGRARRMYEEGQSVYQIARALGVVHTTLWYALTKYTNINMRAAHRYKGVKGKPQLREGVGMTRDLNLNGWYCRGKNITAMMHTAIRGHIECPHPDATLNIETHLFNTILEADTCECTLDVGKELWLNKQRWSRLIKEYVPLEPLERFISQAKEILNGKARLGATANMLFRDPERYDKKHRWGGCLMGATFRGDNKKSGRATLTFYSRTTYIGYMGLLDSAIASVIASQIDEPENISFRWHISSQQLHCFKTLPFIYSQPDLMKCLDRFDRNRGLINHCTPTWKHLAKWYIKVVDGWDGWKGNKMGTVQEWLETEKYGPFRRVKRRWAEHQRYLEKNVPPSLSVSELNFEKAI